MNPERLTERLRLVATGTVGDSDFLTGTGLIQVRDLLREAADALDEATTRAWGPLGDNHHNAAACPYCGDLLGKAQAQAREATARAESEKGLLIEEGDVILRNLRTAQSRAEAALAQARTLADALEQIDAELTNESRDVLRQIVRAALDEYAKAKP